MDMSLIHLAAHDGVDRIFSHPYDKPRDLSPEQQHAIRLAEKIHGIRNTKPKGIRVNQPMNFRSTYNNVIGSPQGPKHKDWLIENYYGSDSPHN